MLTLKNITKKYKVASGDVDALKGLNISFRKNEFVSILGKLDKIAEGINLVMTASIPIDECPDEIKKYA